MCFSSCCPTTTETSTDSPDNSVMRANDWQVVPRVGLDVTNFDWIPNTNLGNLNDFTCTYRQLRLYIIVITRNYVQIGQGLLEKIEYLQDLSSVFQR